MYDSGTSSISTIQDTVRELVRDRVGNLPAGYDRLVDQVITTLEDRERSITNRLLAEGQNQGLDRRIVARTLEDAGLVMPRPEPESRPVSMLDDMRANRASTNGNQGDRLRAVVGEIESMRSRLTTLLDELNRQ
jgi:hypothetical protein